MRALQRHRTIPRERVQRMPREGLSPDHRRQARTDSPRAAPEAAAMAKQTADTALVEREPSKKQLEAESLSHIYFCVVSSVCPCCANSYSARSIAYGMLFVM